jgi:formylmethanofuran:tetrahydromethanopterin formyltransferase
MKSSFSQIVIIVLLLAGAGILWRAGELENRVAAAERDLVTFRFGTAAETANQPAGRLAALMPGEGRTVQDAKHLGATAGYWQGDYEAVAADPDARLLAANAAYRALRREGGSWQLVVGRLDSVVKSYAEVLRNQPDNLEAAFNYEYAVRLRAVIAQRKLPVAPVPPGQTGTTLHGFEGAPPEESDMKKFKMIVPMRPDERLEAEKAGKGTTKVRKG